MNPYIENKRKENRPFRLDFRQLMMRIALIIKTETFSPKTATSIISPKLEFAAGEEQSISHSVAIRRASVLYGKGLEANRKQYFSNSWNAADETFNAFYKQGDECIFKALQFLRESDSDATTNMNIKNGINAEDSVHVHFVNSPPLPFIKPRFRIPDCTGRLVSFYNAFVG